MPLTENSRFEYIGIGYDTETAALSSVVFKLDDVDDDSRYEISLYGGYPPAAGSRRRNLEILQTINASTGGFQNSEGAHIIPRLSEFPFLDTSLADPSAPLPDYTLELEKHGFYNPLVAGSYEKYLKNRYVEGDRMNLETREVKTDGQVVIRSKMGSVPEPYHPDSTTMQVRLTGWDAYYLADNRYIFSYDPVPIVSSLADAIAQEQVQALIAWLKSIKTSGGEIPDDAEFTTEYFGGDRRFTETFSAATGAVEFRIADIVHTTSQGNIAYLAMDIPITSTITSGITGDLTSFFHNSEFPLAVTTETLVPPDQGNFKVPQCAEKVCFPGGAELSWRNNWLYLLTPAGNRALSGARTRIVNWDDLAAAGSPFGAKKAPLDPSIGVVHVHAGSTGQLVIPRAWEMAQPGETAELVVYNKRGSAVVILAADGNTICHVQDNEAITFYVTDNLNEVGEIRAHLRDRLFIADKHETGNIRWLQGGTVFDGGNKVVLPIHNFFIDEGAFIRDGTSTDPSTDLYGAHAVKLAHPGTAELTVDVAFRLASGVAGGHSLPRGWNVKLWRQRGTDYEDFAPPEQAELAGPDAPASVHFSRHDQVQAGDVYALVIDKNGGNLDNDEIEITSLDWKFKLHTNVYHTY